MNCTICGKPVVLNPSAAKRARRDVTGRDATFYTSLFTSHSDCAVQQRETETLALMRRLNGRPA